MINSVAIGFNNQPRPRSRTQCQISFCSAQKGLEKLNNAILKYSQKEKLSLFDRIRFQLILMRNALKMTKEENLIGEGHDAVVFRISDEFVSRHKKIQKGDKLKISLVRKLENPFSDIKSYFGAPLFETGYMKILRNADTGDRFVPCGTPLHANHELPTIEEKIKYENEFVPLCASLPQESYDQLVKDFKKLGDRGFLPDLINHENIIISGNQFKIVDELERIERNVTLFDVLKILLLKYSQGFRVEPKPHLFELRKEIFRKSLIAGEKADMQIGDSVFNYENEQNLLNKILFDSHTRACKIFDKLHKAKRLQITTLDDRINMINKHFKNMHF